MDVFSPAENMTIRVSTHNHFIVLSSSVSEFQQRKMRKMKKRTPKSEKSWLPKKTPNHTKSGHD